MHTIETRHTGEGGNQSTDAAAVGKADSGVEVRHKGSFGFLVAARTFEAGECVLQLDGQVVSVPTRTSIELAVDRHVEDPLGHYVNHSFSPTTAVDRQRGRLVALRRLEPGDEITFDYNVNETRMACPFIDKDTMVPVRGRESQQPQQQ